MMNLEPSGWGRNLDFVPSSARSSISNCARCAHPTLPPKRNCKFFEPHVLSNLVSHLSPFIYLFLPTGQKAPTRMWLAGMASVRGTSRRQDFFAHLPNSLCVLSSI